MRIVTKIQRKYSYTDVKVTNYKLLIVTKSKLSSYIHWHQNTWAYFSTCERRACNRFSLL